MSLNFSTFKNSPLFVQRLWDAWCLASVIGIWPRFIEPQLLITSHHTLPIATLSPELSGLNIVQISDLHYSNHTTKHFLERVLTTIEGLHPDVIVLTGDILCYSQLRDPGALEAFLSKLRAPLGCYAVFGNHDYAEYVSMGDDEHYCRVRDHTPVLLRAFSRLFGRTHSPPDPEVTEPVAEHPELRTLLKHAGVHVMHNETIQLGVGFSKINLTGLGDIMAKQCLPHLAFDDFDRRFPSIVLSHNPDSYSLLRSYPGDLLLFGHTHGGQVNLPFIWKKITPLKNKNFKKGLIAMDNRFLYINRGLGATFPFRWFAPPEITKITLVRSGLVKSTQYTPVFAKAQEGTEVLAPYGSTSFSDN